MLLFASTRWPLRQTLLRSGGIFACMIAWLSVGSFVMGQPFPELPAAPPGEIGSLLDPLGSGDGMEVRGEYTPATADQPARLFVIATVTQGSHVYSITQPKGIGPITTQIRLDRSAAFTQLGPFQAYPPPEKKPEPGFNNAIVEIHHGEVVWHAPISLKGDPRGLQITGGVYGQICTETGCLPPKNFPFVAHQGRGVALPPEQLAAPSEVVPLPQIPEVGPGVSESPLQLPDDPAYPSADVETTSPASAPGWYEREKLKSNSAARFDSKSFWRTIVLGFFGGILLNLMPCVLPVIGLKILSFVEQAGQDRRQALLLNLTYSAGLISVFLALAAAANLLEMGWGEQFQYPAFNITLAAIVFAMALSFLGVWEIPIPGFVGSGKALAATQHEGLSGAFAKGVITTVLATPCTGPFMATALAWAVRQPAHVIYLSFFSVGLGMASPYLLIGAFPRLIAFLPKPGAWMDTFKQIMGFVLLGTVVFIFTFMHWPYMVPTLGLLFGVWIACWLVGRVPLTAPPEQRLRAWLTAAVTVGLAWLVMFPGIDEFASGKLAFGGLHDVMDHRFKEDLEVAGRYEGDDIRWQPFTWPGFEQSLARKQPVLIDFTADYCGTCKFLEAQFLNVPEVREAMKEKGVVPLKANLSAPNHAAVAKEMLSDLGAKQVPVLAIFSPEDPYNPVTFLDGYTTESLLEALDAVRPSGK